MIYLILALIVASYYFNAARNTGKSFIKLNLVWVGTIILLSILFGNLRPLSVVQVATLAFVFAATFTFVKEFNSRFKLKGQNLSNYLILSGVLIAPVVEELFFRGWLIGAIDGTYLEKIMISSLLFGLYHIKNYPLLTKGALLYQMAYAGLIIGPILAFARLETGSVFLPIILHSLNNALSYSVTRLFFPAIVKYKELNI